MSTPSTENPVPVIVTAKTWRERGIDWLFQQGTSTILLLALFSTLVYTWNWWVTVGRRDEQREQTQLIQEGYDRMQKEYNGDLKMVIEQLKFEGDSNRKLFERLLQETRGTRKAIEEAVKEKC